MNYDLTIDQIIRIHQAAEAAAVRSINHLLTLRNWLIGAYIIEFEQNGEDRAKYGERLPATMADDLASRGQSNLSLTNLKYCRALAMACPALAIGQPLADQFTELSLNLTEATNHPTLAHRSDIRPLFPSLAARVSQQTVPEWQNESYYQRLFRTLSWSQLLELARIEDPLKRAFYELECLKNRWSRRELKRQINSLLYERIGLSKDKDAVMRLATEGQLLETPKMILRDPYVPEFLGLEERTTFSESELEQAILDHLQQFLLELGRDFCFVARQYRITVANRHHFLDLLFFHRALRCLLAIDLKLGPFQHEDAGQMNFYLNYLREEVTHPDENPPVGLIFCADKDVEEVHFATAGLDQQLFVSRYLVALPSIEQLKAWLREEQEYLQSLIKKDEP
ncbi:MAG TPA: PDDEXK nuclease domain-containing protein [Blastocatellia bacterium]|nr:PDDEXK nuclease domain-containing protein [Blastocatellia bacterium]